MRNIATVGVILFFLGYAFSSGDEPVVVAGERVNLRARPRRDAEVLGQVNRGQILIMRGTTGEWISVKLPDAVGVWIASGYLANGTVMGDRVYVRAGPGPAHPPLGVLKKGQSVAVRKVAGAWTEIAAPPDATAWIHRDYIRFQTATGGPSSRPVPLPAEFEMSRPEPQGGEGEASAVLPCPEMPRAEEGTVGEVHESFEGVLKRASWLDFGRLSPFALTDHVRGRPVTVCYVHGDRGQLERLVGRRMRVSGPVFRSRPEAKPLVLPRDILLYPNVP